MSAGAEPSLARGFTPWQGRAAQAQLWGSLHNVFQSHTQPLQYPLTSIWARFGFFVPKCGFEYKWVWTQANSGTSFCLKLLSA